MSNATDTGVQVIARIMRQVAERIAAEQAARHATIAASQKEDRKAA